MSVVTTDDWMLMLDVGCWMFLLRHVGWKPAFRQNISAGVTASPAPAASEIARDNAAPAVPGPPISATARDRVRKACQSCWPRAMADKNRPLRRQFAEQRLVEVRLHDIALLVADVIRIAVRLRHPQQIARGRADADGENSQPGFRRVLARFQRASVVVLAVREQHSTRNVVSLNAVSAVLMAWQWPCRPAESSSRPAPATHLLNAVLSIVSGHSKNASPAKATAPSDPCRFWHQFQRGELGAASRFGVMSSPSMLLEVSTPPRCPIHAARPPANQIHAAVRPT